MRSETEINRAVDEYADMVRRLCMLHLKNYADTEDIFQTVFLKYALSSIEFENKEHEKAWLIRVTINACKDLPGKDLSNTPRCIRFLMHAFSFDRLWELALLFYICRNDQHRCQSLVGTKCQPL